jgi:ribosomal protein L37E
MNDVMGGRKERCVNCGSKKITIHGSTKKCQVCGFEWKGKPKRKTAKKEKVRF